MNIFSKRIFEFYRSNLDEQKESFIKSELVGLSNYWQSKINATKTLDNKIKLICELKKKDIPIFIDTIPEITHSFYSDRLREWFPEKEHLSIKSYTTKEQIESYIESLYSGKFYLVRYIYYYNSNVYLFYFNKVD